MGPPGTGKTTRLLELAHGLPDESYALVAFTRVAAQVARQRGLTSPYVKTLHAMAFAQLGLKRGDAMQPSHHRRIMHQLGLPMRRSQWAPPLEGDMIHNARSYACTRRAPLQGVAKQLGVDGRLLAEYDAMIEEEKRTHALLEFHDMLERWRASDYVPASVDTLFIDEAQDLSPVQWRTIDWWLSHGYVRNVYAAGDDDQAIFGWAGADVNEYKRRIRTVGSQEVLRQSRRCPRVVHDLAMRLVNQLPDRVPKGWNPREAHGQLEWVLPDWLPTDWGSGTWLVLAPYGYLLRPLAQHLEAAGVWFQVAGSHGTSVNDALLRAAYDWETWRMTGHREPQLARRCKRFLRAKHVDAYLYRNQQPDVGFLDLAYGPAPDEVEYCRQVLPQYKPGATPNITLSTVHRSKGDQADSVLLLNPQTDRALDTPVNDLLRVLYVAVTRARTALHVTQGGPFLTA